MFEGYYFLSRNFYYVKIFLNLISSFLNLYLFIFSIFKKFPLPYFYCMNFFFLPLSLSLLFDALCANHSKFLIIVFYTIAHLRYYTLTFWYQFDIHRDNSHVRGFLLLHLFTELYSLIYKGMTIFYYCFHINSTFDSIYAYSFLSSIQTETIRAMALYFFFYYLKCISIYFIHWCSIIGSDWRFCTLWLPQTMAISSK